MSNLYERINVKQLSIDSLPIRTSSPKYCQYYDKPQKNIKRCKIIVDSWDAGKIHKTMLLHKTRKEQVTFYYLDIKSGIVRKLKEVVRYYNKRGLKLDTSLVYKGTKSQATKKLDNLMK